MSNKLKEMKDEVLKALSDEIDKERISACYTGILYGLSFSLESTHNETAAELLYWPIKAAKR
jgi:hypothetical protein